jgi:hypothetical protein
MFTELKAEKVQETAEQLTRRIEERFPEAGLRKVAAELVAVCADTRRRARENSRPIPVLRFSSPHSERCFS